MRCFAIRWSIAVLAMALALPAAARAQTQVYVLHQGTESCASSACGPRLELLNSASGRLLASVSLDVGGPLATTVQASSDGTRLYVSAYSAGGGHLYVVDANTKRVLAKIDTGGSRATDVAVLPDNSRAYVVNSTSNNVGVIDLATFTLLTTVAVESEPSNIVSSPDGRAVYVTNSGSNTVSKISTEGNVIAGIIAVGSRPAAIDVSPDGSRLFVVNLGFDETAGGRTIGVIDGNSDSLLRRLPVGSQVLFPAGVAAQSATRIYVAIEDRANARNQANASSVQLLDAATGAVLGSVAAVTPKAPVRNSSGTPTYFIDNFGVALRQLSADGTSAMYVGSTSSPAIDAAVITDHCAFEATALLGGRPQRAVAIFGPAGGSGTITIPAPAGCPWSMDLSNAGGVTVAQPTAGIGPATRAYTVAGTSSPRRSNIEIGRQTLVIEQTIPRMNVELAGGTLQQPFILGGWAFEQNVTSDVTSGSGTGVRAVHVWAYPSTGAPILLGVATYGQNRPDIAAIYGASYAASGFQIVVRGLPGGSYTLVAFAYSTISGTFSNAQAVSVTLQRPAALIAIDTPGPGTVSSPFTVAGWAADPSAAGGGPGIDAVHVWAYPSSGAPPVFVGAAAYGAARPDVAAFLGSPFLHSGYGLTASLPAGTYTLVVFARSIDTRQFSSQTVRITVLNP